MDDNNFPHRVAQVLSDITTTHYDVPYDFTFSEDNLRTRVAAATREDAEGDTVTIQLYDYDDHGNVRKARTELVGFGTFDLDYTYDLISGKVNRADYQKGRPDYFAHRYSYDADNRLLKAETTRDDVFWDRDGRYFYYPHGPLARLEVGQDNVQGMDHYYSIHGWIKGVNMPEYKGALLDPGKDGDISGGGNQDSWVARDAFAYNLGFYDGDYSGIGVGSTGALGTMDGAWSALSAHILGLSGQPIGLYNGNIAMMVTDLKNWNNVAGAGFIGEGIANAYQYDQLNRLKHMRSYDYTAGGGWSRTGSGTGYWDSDYGYDRNGNIDTLSRLIPQWMTTYWDTQSMDELHYDYGLGNVPKQHNKLDHVEDAASSGASTTDLETQSAGNYGYDDIGNLISDPSEYVSAIDWDLHNKVRWVHRATNPYSLAELKFWYDGTGNRVHKQSATPGAAGGPDILHDEWYVRDPQGNEMAVYEQVIEDGWRITRLKEHAIYGADRLGLDLNGVEISRFPIGEEDPEDPTDDPAGRHALVIEEIMYDSPKTPDDAPAGKESNEGEYLVLVNKSRMDLDLGDYTIHVGGDSLVLEDTLPAGERLILGYGDDAGEFARLVVLPVESMDELVMQSTLPLLDRGGIVHITYTPASTLDPSPSPLIDALAYGDFYGLSAENPYLADSLIDSLGRRSSLKYVAREEFAGFSAKGGEEIEAEVGTYYLNRGRKVYECKNHLGNVLAVVSDVKLGQSTSSLVDYYIGDVVEMTDYEPFGMQLANRHWVSGDRYRFGFQAQEGDDEWNGEGNMLAFKYRVHDVRLGRFLSVDPLSASYPWYSAYQFAGNTPIWAIDIEGAEPLIKSGIALKILYDNAPVGSCWYQVVNGRLYLTKVVSDVQINSQSHARAFSLTKSGPIKEPSATGYDETALEGSDMGYNGWHGAEGQTKARFAIDAFGMLPTVGVAFDLLNAYLSACEGNWVEAGNYVIFAIPGQGDLWHFGGLLYEGSLKASEFQEKLRQLTEFIGHARQAREKANRFTEISAFMEEKLAHMRDLIPQLAFDLKHAKVGDNIGEMKTRLAAAQQEVNRLEKELPKYKALSEHWTRKELNFESKIRDIEYEIQIWD